MGRHQTDWLHGGLSALRQDVWRIHEAVGDDCVRALLAFRKRQGKPRAMSRRWPNSARPGENPLNRGTIAIEQLGNLMKRVPPAPPFPHQCLLRHGVASPAPLFHCNTATAYAATGVLHRPVESPVTDNRKTWDGSGHSHATLHRNTIESSFENRADHPDNSDRKLERQLLIPPNPRGLVPRSLVSLSKYPSGS